MAQATAQQKLLIANRAKTRRAGERLEFETSKDMSGWMGPATVADLSGLRDGLVHVRWQGRLLIVRILRCEEALVFAVFLRRPSNPVKWFREAVGEVLYVWDGSSKVRSGFLARPTTAGLMSCVLGSISRAIVYTCKERSDFALATPSRVFLYDDTVMLWSDQPLELLLPKYVNLERLTGEKNISFVQLFMVDDNLVSELRGQVDDDTPHVGRPHEPNMPNLPEIASSSNARKSPRRKAIADGPVDQPEPQHAGAEAVMTPCIGIF